MSASPSLSPSSSSGLIGVTGATGQLGKLAVAALLARGVPATSIVALVRSPARWQQQQQQQQQSSAAPSTSSVAARAFDYSKGDELASSLQGVTQLLLVSSSEVGQREAQHRAVIAAAQAAGVGRIVYTSLLRADTSQLAALPAEHVATELLLRDSAVPFTILRNGWYSENYESSVKAALAHGALVGASGAGRVSAASRADYADAAAAVLTSAGHEGRTYELAGDEAFTLEQLAAEISAQSGKAVPFKNLTVDEYRAVLVGAGVPAGYAALIAAWEPAIEKGALLDEDRQLSTLTGKPTRGIKELVAAVRSA